MIVQDDFNREVDVRAWTSYWKLSGPQIIKLTVTEKNYRKSVVLYIEELPDVLR